MPIAAALTPMAPVAVVPVTLTSSPVPALPVMLPPGLPPLVQATTEVEELNKSLDTKELAQRVGAELQAGVADGKVDPQQQTLTRKGPTTGTVAFSPQTVNLFCAKLASKFSLDGFPYIGSVHACINCSYEQG